MHNIIGANSRFTVLFGWEGVVPSCCGRHIETKNEEVRFYLSEDCVRRLSGLLLAAIAIQTMAEGLRVLFPGLA